MARVLAPSLWLAVVLGFAAGPALAGVVTLDASRDSTLIETPDGSLANGAGHFLFAGRTSQSSGSMRRALLAFDVAGAIAPGATIAEVTLTLHLSQTNASVETLHLHRVGSDWGEGESSADGGRGAPAMPGDATWLHGFHDATFWSQPGGDFDPVESASAEVDQPGFHTWSTPQMAADLQAWLDDPAGNLGWILIGNESDPSTVKRFDSRENADVMKRPELRVEYQRGRGSVCRDAGLGGAAFGFCNAYCEALDCDEAPRASLAVCARLEGLFREATGGNMLPCEMDAGPRCPCFEVTEVAALILMLQDETTYTELSCIDTRISAKPLTTVRTERLDGEPCATASFDCSAVAFEFTEDNICQLNPPAPELPVNLQGISDLERSACRENILDAATGLGLACN